LHFAPFSFKKAAPHYPARCWYMAVQLGLNAMEKVVFQLVFSLFMPAQSSSFRSVATMKFRHKQSCPFIDEEPIYSVASWSWSQKDGDGSIINFFIFK
jgi:hypothetical protein